MVKPRPKTRIDFDDALNFVLNGNESDIEELSSDDELGEVEETDSDGIGFEPGSDCDKDDCEELGGGSVKDADTDELEEDDTASAIPKGHVKQHAFRWRKKDIPVTPGNFVMESEKLSQIKSPIDHFKLFWTDELNELIVEQTNLYSTQKRFTSINTNKSEIEQFIGMQLKMGIVQLPSYKLYWSQQMRYPPVADVMPIKRYEKLRSFVHFVDNATYDQKVTDKLFKIRPVIENVRQQCLKIIPEESHSIDEQIIPAKTKYSGIRQYNPKKPKKWGFKNLVRAGASGIMYDFYIYVGKLDDDDRATPYSQLEKSAQVVARLCEHLPMHANHKLYFDNWFTTLSLLIYLKRNGILSCGTIRPNRLHGCQLSSNKELKESGRGSVDFKSDMNSGLVVVKWMDNGPVHIASNYLAVQPLGSVQRWCQKEKHTIDVACPRLILHYNKGMGGVDLADMLIALYRIPIKAKRWYIKIFWHLVDICKTNAWLLYRRHCSILNIPKKQRLVFVDFIISVADALINAEKLVKFPSPGRPGRPKKGRKEEFLADPVAKRGKKATTPLPCDEARFDQLGHWPEPTNGKRQRCRYCSDGFSKIYCSKCKICLCLREGKNCFKDFHWR